jgi:hypothetical protein
MNTQLKFRDADTGQVINISLVSGPSHGTASIAYTTTSTGGIIVPTGLSYTPATGYVGDDSIVASVSDGITTSTSVFRITVNPIPSAPVLTGASSLCLGGTTTLSASPTGGLWGSTDGNTSVGVTTGIVTGRGGGSSILYYNGPYNSYGCRTQSRVTLSVLGVPLTGTLSGASTVCAGASTTITPSIAGGTWNSSNTAIATVTSGGSVTGVASGAMSLSYTVSNGCFSAVVTKPITVPGATTPGPIGGVPYLCEGATLTLTNALAGGSWSSTNTSAALISGSGVVSGIAAGYTNIIYSYTNACGITGSVMKPVTVLPLPVAGVISGPSSVPVGSSITLSTTGTGGVWSSVTPAFATVNTIGVVNGVGVGIDTIKYKVTNNCGVATATKVVTVTAGRVINNGTVAAGTEGDDITLYPNPTSGVINLDIPGSTGTNAVMVTDMSGKVVLTEFTNDGKISLDLSKLAAGSYHINVNTGNRLFTQLVVVE